VDLHCRSDSAISTAASSLEDPLVANTEKENRDADIEKLEQADVSAQKSDTTSATTTATSSLDQSEMPSNAINAVSVISSAMASLHTSDEDVSYKISCIFAIY